MLNNFLPYEEKLFFLINGNRSHFLDDLMWLFSSLKIWFPLAIVMIFCVTYKKCWKQWLTVLMALIIVFVLCDQFSSHLIKPLFKRLRPTHFPGIMEHVKALYNYTGGRYGFISGHAANSFGFATFTSLLYRNKLYYVSIFLWAALISYSRIYLGVHFVSDIFGGMTIGIILGFLIYLLFSKIQIRIQAKMLWSEYPAKQINMMSVIILSYILLIILLEKSWITFLT